jgi:hypothetical protein
MWSRFCPRIFVCRSRTYVISRVGLFAVLTLVIDKIGSQCKHAVQRLTCSNSVSSNRVSGEWSSMPGRSPCPLSMKKVAGISLSDVTCTSWLTPKSILSTAMISFRTKLSYSLEAATTHQLKMAHLSLQRSQWSKTGSNELKFLAQP